MLSHIALILSIVTPVLHILTLLANSDATLQDPISTLSQGPWAVLHTTSLLLFGAAQIILGVALAGRDRGWFWPYARGGLIASGASLFYVAYYFAVSGPDTLRGPNANDPLWLVASLAGLTMGLLQPGLWRIQPGLGRFNAVCLCIWLLLIPAVLLIGTISLGVYERTVGAIYVVWVAGVSYAVSQCRRKEGTQS